MSRVALLSALMSASLQELNSEQSSKEGNEHCRDTGASKHC